MVRQGVLRGTRLAKSKFAKTAGPECAGGFLCRRAPGAAGIESYSFGGVPVKFDVASDACNEVGASESKRFSSAERSRAERGGSGPPTWRHGDGGAMKPGAIGRRKTSSDDGNNRAGPSQLAIHCRTEVYAVLRVRFSIYRRSPSGLTSAVMPGRSARVWPLPGVISALGWPRAGPRTCMPGWAAVALAVRVGYAIRPW